MRKEYKQSISLDDVDNTLPKVKTFLDAVAINSESSRKIYRIGLAHAQTFLKSKGETLETIIKALLKEKMDRYSLIQEYINYLVGYHKGQQKLSPRSMRIYLTGLKSYLGNNKIYFIPQEYKARVREPKIYQEDGEELAIDETEVRRILLACSNKRLKTFLAMLASGGTRSKETLNIRWKDIDFDSSPTKISLRGDKTKTKKSRYFFISDEATRILRNWMEYKYRPRDDPKYNIKKQDTDYVFVVSDKRNRDLNGVYKSLESDFNDLLKSIGMDQRKEGQRTRKITFHQFRSFVYSTVSDVDSQFAEWLLGHKSSSYWKKKPEVKRQKYIECMKYLQFLDYSPIEKLSKDTQSQIKEKGKEIDVLREEVTQLNKQIEIFRPLIEQMTDIRQCPQCKRMSIRIGDPACPFCGKDIGEETVSGPDDYLTEEEGKHAVDEYERITR